MTRIGPRTCLKFPLCPNLTKKFQKEVSQMANRNLSCMMLLGGLSVKLWCIQTQLEQDQKWELNQHKWVIRHYVILSHRNGKNGQGQGTRGMVPILELTWRPLQWNLRCLVQYISMCVSSSSHCSVKGSA